MNSDGSFSYVHGVGTEAAPLELLYEDSPLKCYVSVDGKSANFQNIPKGASFPTAMGKIENRQLMTKIGENSFLGVAELSEGRTFFLLNAQPVDILTMLQVLKLKDKTLDEVYNFSVELFKLSASHKVNLENDFMSLSKHTRDFIDSVGEKERVLKKLQDERQARGNNDYNELGITAVSNGAIYQYGLETLTNSLLTITLSKMSNTADINADIGLISAGSTLQTAQRTLTKGTHKLTLTPATTLIGVLHHLGVKKPRKISRWYILVNAKAADILTIHEMVSLQDQSIEEEYGLAVELFQLASTYPAPVAADFLRIPKTSRKSLEDGKKSKLLFLCHRNLCSL